MVSLTTSLIGCFIVSATIGFIYDFSIYSGALKLHFHLDQGQLDWVATAGCLMFFVSPICGHLVDKHGPRPGVLFGVHEIPAESSCLGALGLWLGQAGQGQGRGNPSLSSLPLAERHREGGHPDLRGTRPFPPGPGARVVWGVGIV